MRKYTPHYGPGESTADEFENEKWKEAYKGRETLGHFCLSLVSKAILDYLLYFIMREVGASKPDDVSTLTKLKGRSTFEKYENFLLERTKFTWDESPVGRDQIEQINLCRNDFIHDPDIDSGQPKQIHSLKYPDCRFIDPLDQVVQAAMETVISRLGGQQKAELGELAEIPGEFALTATKELFSAIADAGKICAFVETQKTQPLKL